MGKSKEDSLYDAISAFNVKEVQQLIKAGADIKDYSEREKVIDSDSDDEPDIFQPIPHLTWAAESTPENEEQNQAKYNIIRELIKGGADVNHDNHLMALDNNLDLWTFKIFIDNGYNLNKFCYDTHVKTTNLGVILRQACDFENPDEHKPLIKLFLLL